MVTAFARDFFLYFLPLRIVFKSLHKKFDGVFIKIGIAGCKCLAVTFFYEPVLVKTDADGYAVGGPKPERMRIELSEEFREYERTSKEEAT